MRLSRLIYVTLRHFENRLFELATAVMMVLIAMHLVIWPGAISAGEFRHVMLPPAAALVGAYGIGGCLRVAALIANGSWPVYGPLLRAGGAVAGSMIWAQMFASLLLVNVEIGNPPPLDIWVYLTLTAVELIAMCRALVDHAGPG